MNSNLYRDLAWLPKKPHNFSLECKSIDGKLNEFGKHLQMLANHALDSNDLIKLAKAFSKGRDLGATIAPLQPMRLAIISNATTNFLAQPLIATALRHGIALEVIETDFGQILQECLSSESKLHQSRPDVILFSIDYHGLPIKVTPGDLPTAENTVASCLNFFEIIRSGVRANSNAICIFQTIAKPVESLFGHLDASLPGTMRSLLDAINRQMLTFIAGTSDLIFDVASLAETVGLSNWHDSTLWNMAKIPFSQDYLAIYAEHTIRLLAAVRGKSRRCLILDLDNTLWGGIIGDDGLEGILIGQGDGTGEAFLSVQKLALDLRSRGIVLAVSSKNTDEIAREPFQKHPDMLLRESHIAVFQANWNDKASNIKAIAEELSLGLDAMVFLDDNPAERGLVRQILPQVAVPELPDDPAYYAQTLMAGGYFEAVIFSEEDQKRADFYQNNSRRVALQSQAGDVDAYLQTLDMQISFNEFDDIGRSRITQLINKSNQFNLTTKRYTEAEVLSVQNDPDCFTLQVRLADVFGDNGMISVIICRLHQGNWMIDTWLMSCRVLKRKVEIAVLMELVANAKLRGISKIIGQYIPTDRNGLVKNHYSELGFAHFDTDESGVSNWILDVESTAMVDLPMTVHRGV